MPTLRELATSAGPMINEQPPIIIAEAPLPFPTRINYAIRLWTMKIFVKMAINLASIFFPRPASKRPTYTKVYPVRPSITNRVFIPSSHKPGEKLPLYISIHGGGFSLCDPRVDDDFASRFSSKHGICVVSIGYRLGPRKRFPTQVFDIAELAQAVINDPDLPCDKSKVAIGGFSAGGNLALAAVQLDGLDGRIAGVVGFYPVVDFAKPITQKLQDRPATEKKDMLADSGKWFNWAYLRPGEERQNPLLSPAFADKLSLPDKICLIGCEYDILCKEAEDMALTLAADEEGTRKEINGEDCWEKGGVRWEKVKEKEHGFDHIPAIREAGNQERADKLHDDVADWLLREVYA
ncbi:MAG: hypothetical protein MMC33_006038 [Icmadophila ericetorum]|nr:hypothetical protein [Icmadophila ericetorum]